MQIRGVHHQRQANHIHTKTHAIFQEADGLGDFEPKTVVKLGEFFIYYFWGGPRVLKAMLSVPFNCKIQLVFSMNRDLETQRSPPVDF